MAIEDKDTATDLSVAPVVGPDDPRRFTDSGIEVKTLYTSETCPRTSTWGSPASSPTRAACTPTCTASAAGRCASTRAMRRRRSPTSATSTCSRTARPGCRMAFDLPTQLGLDSDDPRSLGEVGRTGVAIDTLDDMRTAFDGIPLDEVSTSMTINAPAAVLLLLYELVAEEQGVDSTQAQGHGPERHPQGVHRARELHLPARAEHAADHGPVRLLQGAHPALEHVLDLRLPLPREGRVGGPGGRVHARERHGLRAGGARRRPEGRRLRAPPGLLLQRPQQRLPGGREVPRRPQHVGARDEGALRRAGPEVADAALPHADRRRHADRPAAAQQRRPRRAAGLRGGLRRHAVAAHQRLRRGARAAVRARRQARAADPAGDRLRVRRDRHRRPVRRLLLRRGADRGDRAARVGADREGRRAGRLGRGDRVHQERDRGVRLRLPRALPDQAGHRGRRQRERRGLRRGRGDPERRPAERARPARAAEGLQGRAATRS